MEQDENGEAIYRRRPPGSYMPGTAEDQGAVLRAELAANGIDAEPPESPSETFVRRMMAAEEDMIQERAAAVLERYRPILVAEFGETITDQIMSHPAFTAYVAEVYDSLELEPDEAAFEAAQYLQDNPEATPAEAFTAVRDRAAGA